MARIIIIGGGVAGMAAGIRALRGGHEAVIAEAHSVPGGNLTGWDRDGYHIDNCIHWLTGTNPVTEMYGMWRELGVPVDGRVNQGETLYTYASGGGALSLSRSIEKLERDLRRCSRGDDREITRFLRAVSAAKTVCGISATDNAKAATASEVVRHAPRLLPYLMMSTGQLADRFHSPMIRGFLRSLLGDRFGAVALLIVFATFCGDNGGVPAGSSCAMARAMAGRFRALGGVLMCSAPAARVELAGGRAVGVTLADGRKLTADHVVLACDPGCAFGKLLPAQYLPESLRRRYGDPKRRLFSSFHCAFGCEGEKLPFAGDLILDLPDKLRRSFGTDKLILREFSHEPTFAPRGKSLIQAMCFCSRVHSMRFIHLSANRELYRAEKELLAERIRETAEDRLPSLNGRLKLVDCWTPATYRRFTGTPTGSYIGFTLPAGRIPSMIPPKVKGIANLYLATQWQQEPGGLPTAASAGIAAAEAIIRAEAKRSAARAKAPRAVWTPDSLTAE